MIAITKFCKSVIVIKDTYEDTEREHDRPKIFLILIQYHQKIEPAIVEKAIQCVDGFEKVFNTTKQQTILCNQNESTLNNYI